jgi:PAS domain S-box-containing protein
MDFATNLFDASEFTPPQLCGGWNAELVWLHIVSDAMIWLAYLAIPIVLIVFIRRRRDMPYPALFWLFGAFILGSGLTHFMELVTFIKPLYRLAGLVKLGTAAVSWVTVIALVPVIPQALRLRGPKDLEREIEERKRAERALYRKTMFLRLLKEAAVAANEASTVESAMQTCLNCICDQIGWPIGHAYLFAEAEADMKDPKPVTLWHVEVPERLDAVRQVMRVSPIARERGLLGRVVATGKPVWSADVTADAIFEGADVTKNLGVRSGFAFPVLVGKEVAAVLEFFSTHPAQPDRPLLDVMVHIGTQLGRVIERARAEQALRHSEMRFRSVAQSANEAIISADGHGKIISWNRGAQMVFGYSEEEVIGQPLTVLMPERYREAHRRGLERLHATGESRILGRTVELHGVRKDSEEFPVEMSLADWQTAQGQFYSGIVRDITERKKNEERLRLSEERLRLLVEGVSGYAILMLDPQGNIASWNAGAERIKGYQAEEILGKHFSAFYPPDAVAERRPERALQTAATEGRFEDEGWRVRKDGSQFWANVVITALRDEAGNLIGFSKITCDLTERKRKEETIQRYADIVGNVQVGLVILRLEDLENIQSFRIVAMNPAASQITTVPAEQVVGKKLLEVGPAAYGTKMPEVFADVVRSGTGRNIDEFHYRHEGAEGIYSIKAFPLPNDCVGLAFEDITERKHTEEEILRLNEQLKQWVIEVENANKELEAFSYSVSHDLRAPLRAMDGFSRIVLEDCASELSKDAQRYLQLVRDSAQQMGRLIDDLLNFSRLSRQPLQKRPIAPVELVRRVLEDLRREQEGRQVEIALGELPACQADPALLKQVLVNLLGNALKYTRVRERALIEIGCHESGSQADERVYFVKDNGVGFDMRYAHRLFGVFQRLHRTEEYEGTGVGLATVQRIIHRHGGRVWAEAEVDQGATFYFTLGNGDRND